MKLFNLLSSALALRLVGAYLVSPPGTAAPGTTEDCSEWVQQSYEMTCAIIEEYYGMTEAQFEAWNPITTQLGSGCNLVPDLYYCVQVNFTSLAITATGPASTVASATVTKPSVLASTSTSTCISTTTNTCFATPTPIQAGAVANCKKFYYVNAGDTCDFLATQYGLTVDDFIAWNPAVGASCLLTVHDWYCISISAAPTTTVAPKSTSTSTCISTTTNTCFATPSPIQAGAVANCKKFYYVNAGDTCDFLATKYGTTVANIIAWNPAVGSSCLLTVHDWYCISVTATPTTTAAPKSTSTSTCISTTTNTCFATPSPIQAGAVANCKKFYYVNSGDTCAFLASKYGITVDNIIAWNPAVGSACNIDVHDWYCISITDAVTTHAPTNTVPSTCISTTTATCYATPAPIQAGAVAKCKKFYYVNSGDTCSFLSTKYGVTVANIISWNPAVGSACNIDVHDWYCIGT